MKVTILGSGTSHGIPVIGCGCPVCTSNDSRDIRMRCSLYIEGPGEERFVIDTGPEFRLQAVRAKIAKLDAVFLTHSHADHLHGLDDVRPLSDENPVPVYGNEAAITEMKERFSYVFNPNTQEGGGKPKIKPVITNEPVMLGKLTITPFPVKHGSLDILSWYIAESATDNSAAPEGLLYMTDTSAIDSKILAVLPRPKILIIGGLRVRPHSTHFSFKEALDVAARIKCREAYLTHICHTHFHKEIEEYCNEYVGRNNIKNIKMGPAWDNAELFL